MMMWQEMGTILLWCVAIAYVAQHLICTYTNRTSCDGCSHRPSATKQRDKPVFLGASLQRGLQLARKQPQQQPR
ncbi:MAG: hypothetical protein AAF320_04700, partial [Myxococcota bacterium]